MREFVVVIQEEDLYHIKLSAKGTGGLACKGLLKIMLESVTNVRGTLQTSINQKES